jgi:4-amino-4-deoxy-L-arabinose transferase-like glycosyltransferase
MSRAVTIALGIVALSLLLSPLQRELYVGDETKYGQVVREMRAGAFFLPTLEGSPFTHKPPLHFWIVGALTYPFGLYSIWPYVIPSIAAFGLLLWLMQRWGGPMAAFVCGTSLMVWGSAQTARMDVSFTALLVLAAWLVQRSFDGERTLVWTGIVTGVAALIKGPMAPVIIVGLVAFEALRRRQLPRDRWVLAMLAMLLVPLLWLVPAVLIGGEAFWREIFFKQTVGRAVGAWVHRSPPWFYLLRAPATLLPWFFLLVAALVAIYKRRDERAKFAVSWMLAVLVPYSLMSSKLDVYMMALIPPVALVVARFLEVEDRWTRWGRNANALMLVILLTIGVLGMFMRHPELEGRPGLRVLFAILALAALGALAITMRAPLVASTLATGLVLIVTLAYAAVALVPLANELASTRPLVRALVRQNVPAREVALFVCPHLWTRNMPHELSRATHVDAAELARMTPRLIVVRRKDGDRIAATLRGYRKVDELQMIGKWFDVYRR